MNDQNPLIANNGAKPIEPSPIANALRRLPLLVVDKEPNGEGGYSINATPVVVNVIDPPDDEDGRLAGEGLSEEESGDIEQFVNDLLATYDNNLVIPIMTNAANSGYDPHTMFIYLLAEFQDKPVEVIHNLLATIMTEAAMELRLNPN